MHFFGLISLKKLVSESPSKKSSSNRSPERGRTTPQHRQERRDRDRERTTENKENVAAHNRDVDLFALPPPRTPASSKRNARQKNALTSPNQNANAGKGHAVTPKGERSHPLTHAMVIMKSSSHQTFYLFTVIDFPCKQTLKYRNLH